MTNTENASNLKALFTDLVQDGQMYDLSHAMSPTMPVFPRHVPYSITLNRRHGDPHDTPRPDGSSFSNEVIVMPGHVSTHIDALGHFSRHGCVYGGARASDVETHCGLSSLDAAEIKPIWRSAVMLDVAAHRGVDVLEPGSAVRADELAAVAKAQGTPVRSGDIVLVRTGWANHWTNGPMFNDGDGRGLPGPCSDGAQWLIDQGVFMVGSDTPAFEAIPWPGDSVHSMLLVDQGIHIIENLNLEEISAQKVWRFLFVGLPLRIVGGTGAPFRPVAIV